MAWTGVITNAGATLLENWAAGSQTLTIDKATTGSGTLASEAQMRAAIAVSNEVEDASIISSAPTTGGTQYVVQVGAREDGAYALRQIGIWAHLSDNAPSLLALYQSDTDIDIPATADNADFVYTMNAIVSMSNSGSMSVTIDRGAYVTSGSLETALASYVKTVDGVAPDANGNVAFKDFPITYLTSRDSRDFTLNTTYVSDGEVQAWVIGRIVCVKIAVTLNTAVGKDINRVIATVPAATRALLGAHTQYLCCFSNNSGYITVRVIYDKDSNSLIIMPLAALAAGNYVNGTGAWINPDY